MSEPPDKVPDHAHAIRLVRYADGVPEAGCFELGKAAVAPLNDGDVLVRTLYLGMDPFPRLRISGPGGRAPPLALGSVMIGRGVGEVVASRDPGLAKGALVAGELGWRDYATVGSAEVKRFDPHLGPAHYSLGVLGPSGLAAWCSLKTLGEPKPGETVLVSAAPGSVGSVAVQIARITGCRVIGVGGGPQQLAYLREDLGIDGVDFRAPEPLAGQIKALAPSGVDVVLDLVGGDVFDAAMANLAVHGRAVLVGTLADYNQAPGEADTGPRHNLSIILKRARLLGFLAADHAADFPQALAQLSGWLRSGELKVRERIVDGLENAPAAFAGLFGTEFIGKQLVRVAPNA